MALTFPAGPVGGQTYTGPNGVTYTYNATLGVCLETKLTDINNATTIAELETIIA